MNNVICLIGSEYLLIKKLKYPWILKCLKFKNHKINISFINTIKTSLLYIFLSFGLIIENALESNVKYDNQKIIF